MDSIRNKLIRCINEQAISKKTMIFLVLQTMQAMPIRNGWCCIRSRSGLFDYLENLRVIMLFDRHSGLSQQLLLATGICYALN